jgi:pyruvate/2-oxoglutarate dehydrogenase complex dihydrolipoamide acyltransferase (E2) component
MSQLAYFNLPDVGEGLTEAEIVSWKVKPGDHVTVNQIIVEIETAKSLVELPCPFEGVVAELFAQEGETVEVGRPIISATVSDGAIGATATSAIPIVSPERLRSRKKRPRSHWLVTALPITVGNRVAAIACLTRLQLSHRRPARYQLSLARLQRD